MIEEKNLLQRIFEFIYNMIIFNFLFFAGTVLGGVFFSIVPAGITIFEFINFAKNNNEFYKRRVLKIWWTVYKKNLKQYWFVSFVFVLIFLITIIDLIYFSQFKMSYQIALKLFFLFLCFSIIFVYLWFCFVACNYEKISFKEKIKNAVCLFGASLIEMIILASIYVFVFLLVDYFFPRLVFFLGFGFIFVVMDFVAIKNISGRNIFNLFESFKNKK